MADAKTQIRFGLILSVSGFWMRAPMAVMGEPNDPFARVDFRSRGCDGTSDQGGRGVGRSSSQRIWVFCQTANLWKPAFDFGGSWERS